MIATCMLLGSRYSADLMVRMSRTRVRLIAPLLSGHTATVVQVGLWERPQDRPRSIECIARMLQGLAQANTPYLKVILLVLI